MPVLEQITEVSDKFFDAAESANERAHGATTKLVNRLQDRDLPFADRLPEVKVPLVDKLPEPIEAVDAYFGFWAKGIETNRAFSEKVIGRFSDSPTPVAEAGVVETSTAKEAAPKDTPKKTATKTASAKKATKS